MNLKLFIDAGHGQDNIRPGKYDPGAVSAGIEEADQAYLYQQTGKYVCGMFGVPCAVSRQLEETPSPLAKRVQLAESLLCTHYISLHLNAGPILATGTETITRTKKGAANRAFCELVQDAGIYATRLRDRGIKDESVSPHKRLAVMDFHGPVALLEVGFITNPRDRKVVTSRSVRLAFWTRLLENLTR